MKKDLDLLNINLSFEEIAGYSKAAFKKLVKDSVKKKAFSELKEQQGEENIAKEKRLFTRIWACKST